MKECEQYRKMQNISVIQLDVMLDLQTDKRTPGLGSNYPNQANFKSRHAALCLIPRLWLTFPQLFTYFSFHLNVESGNNYIGDERS